MWNSLGRHPKNYLSFLKQLGDKNPQVRREPDCTRFNWYRNVGIRKLNFPFQCLILLECSSVFSCPVCFLEHIFPMLYDFKHHQNRHLFLGTHLQVMPMSHFCLWEYCYIVFPCSTSVMRETEIQNKMGEYENSASAEMFHLSLPIARA